MVLIVDMLLLSVSLWREKRKDFMTITRKLILVVCSGNMQRSVIAEQCINKVLKKRGLDDRYFVISRGI